MKLKFQPNEQNALKLLRINLAIVLTIAFYFVFQAMLVELHAPGTGEQSSYASTAYVFMGLSCLIAVPLWIHKIKAIKAFQENLNKTYGDNEIAKDQIIAETVKKMIFRSIPQIAVAFVGAIIFYYFVSTYIITPELKQSYIDYFRIQAHNYNYSDFNISTMINSTGDE